MNNQYRGARNFSPWRLSEEFLPRTWTPIANKNEQQVRDGFKFGVGGVARLITADAKLLCGASS